jgi:hypothetical protein
MRKIEMFLSNPFDDAKITSLRLVRFAQNAAEALRSEFPAAATEIDGRVETVLQTLGSVAFQQAERSTGTRRVNDFLDALRAFMRTHEDALSVACGGRASAGFRAFLPKGLSEFTNLSKTGAPETLKRIKEALAQYGTALPQPVLDGLNAFVTEWNSVRTGQQAALEKLDARRNVRDDARMQLEWALLDALHDVGKKYKKEVEKGERFFDGSLLGGKKRRKEEEVSETVS